MLQNILANSQKAVLNVLVAVSQHSIPKFGKLKISLFICLAVFGESVLSSVDLDHKSCACDIEIDDMVTDVLLTIDGDGEPFQKIIPQMFFFGGHVLAEDSCIGGEVLVVVILHGWYAPPF